LLFTEDIPGATPIDDVSGLIPTHISTRSELNEWETANILKAVKYHLSEKRKLTINIQWLKKLHKEMFGESWKWAGKFRQRNLSLGIDWHNINDQIKALVDDIAYWRKNNSLSIFEQSIRIHHRLVKIHPFENGNGRHARLVSDIYLYNNNESRPIWPSDELIEKSNIRDKYISALKDADSGNYSTLKHFTAELMKR